MTSPMNKIRMVSRLGLRAPFDAVHALGARLAPGAIDVERAYFAYSTARVSRMTVTLMCPGYWSSFSMRLAMSRDNW